MAWEKKMTAKEAIIYLEGIANCICSEDCHINTGSADCPQITHCNDVLSCEMGIFALETLMPKKPLTNVIHYPYKPDVTVVQCPSCKRRLRTRLTQAKGDKFCPDCGQAIDWNGIEKRGGER